MRIVICDDERKNLIDTRRLLEAIGEERGLDVEVFAFESPLMCLEFMRQHTVDIVISAILMQEMLGTVLAQKLRELKGAGFSLIFLTKSNDYAMESYALNASYYLLKPVDKEKLVKAITKTGAFTKEKMVYLGEGKNTVKIDMQKIIAVEAANKKCRIYTTASEIEVITTFTNIINHLPQEIFWNVHRSYLINHNYIIDQKHNDFIMKNKMIVPIGQTRLSCFKARYAKLLLEKSKI